MLERHAHVYIFILVAAAMVVLCKAQAASRSPSLAPGHSMGLAALGLNSHAQNIPSPLSVRLPGNSGSRSVAKGSTGVWRQLWGMVISEIRHVANYYF